MHSPLGATRRSGAPRSRLVSGLLVATVLLATVLGTFAARHKEDDDVRRARQDAIDNAVTGLGDGFARTAAVLATADALVDTSGFIDTDRLAVFAQVLLAPGGPASALAYEPLVTRSTRARFESTTGITIVDRLPDGSGFTPAPERDEYFPVMAVEPDSGATRPVLGFDIGQDPARGDATRRAASLRQAQITSVVDLAASGRAGFLIIQPLVASDERVVGFLTVTYVGEDAGRAMLAGMPEGSRLRVRDGDRVLFDTGPRPSRTVVGTPSLGGRQWTLELDQPLDPSRSLSLSVLALGIGLAAILALESTLSHRHERVLVDGRRQLTLERDLATGLAAAATKADVARLAASLIPAVVEARAVRVGLRDGDDLALPVWDPVDDEPRPPGPAEERLRTAVEAGQAVFVHDERDLVRQFPDPPPAPAAPRDASWAGGSRALLPLMAGPDVLGVLGFAYDDVQPFDDAQVRRLREVTTIVAGALDRAQVHDTHAHVALTLQRDLLPGSLPSFPPFELSATYHPADVARVGGDRYDAFELRDGRLAVVVGDVAGNGIRAAASMGKIRHVIRACAGAYREPSVVLEQANLLICRANPHLFATACYLTIDRDGHCSVAAAGHLPALHVHADGVRLVETRTGPPLGVREDATFADHEFSLAPGDSLVLYTDGLVERRDEPLDTSLARLMEAGERRGPWKFAADVLASSDDLGGRDDVVVLLVRRDAAPEDADA